MPRADTVNQAGGAAYSYGPEAKLAQLAATGTLADGFNDAVFDAMARFAKGETRDWVEIVQNVEV